MSCVGLALGSARAHQREAWTGGMHVAVNRVAGLLRAALCVLHCTLINLIMAHGARRTGTDPLTAGGGAPHWSRHDTGTPGRTPHRATRTLPPRSCPRRQHSGQKLLVLL